MCRDDRRVVISFAGCCTGVNELISSPSGSTTIPPGCCPGASAGRRRSPARYGQSHSFACRLSALLVIIFHISERRLVRQRTDRSGTERLTFTENNLRIFMRFALIITGEVQVDIRLLVSLKSKECLKRNVKPVFCQLLAAHRTDLIRHITSAPSGRTFLPPRNQNRCNGSLHNNNEDCSGFTSVIPDMVATNEDPTEPREPTR